MQTVCDRLAWASALGCESHPIHAGQAAYQRLSKIAHFRSSDSQRRLKLFRMMGNVICASIIIATITGRVLSRRSKAPAPLPPPAPLLGLFIWTTDEETNYPSGCCLGEREPMTIENDVLREDLRAWMRSPTMGLPEYSSDPSVQRRVGRMLANFNTKFFASGAKTNSGQFYTDANADKP